ncbi:hypothetical protein MPUL_41340 [Mycolicibacterium pulveris]|uniref:Acyl-CoA dehydrogenase n=1 Tax=Mycolicibacterium pulveris TaxID=36813 RepID=A0A7I7US58_MYCPV|nr:aldehyde dehydrogenase family protein [Mycolicibacterium pulveris]BBY82976.1 hypothetical protein MPUL_41340 [Mycolicibacterium pulveris]
MFADVDPASELGQEEVFGPVLAVIPVRDPDDALRIANGTPYGLSGAVWGPDLDTAIAFARRVQTGQLDINGGMYNPVAPFGGYKRSGVGRELAERTLPVRIEHGGPAVDSSRDGRASACRTGWDEPSSGARTLDDVTELLAAGAPVAAHWIADRQIVPSLLKYGTEHQKKEFLPRIVRGECYFGIGMSEPDSGSDLASVRTKAVPVDGGWLLSGTKVWTSGAHRAHAFIALARTAPVDPDNRHAGLSQFIVDLRGPGVHIRPVVSMNGAHHFNEVILDEAFVPEEMVFGEIGAGWQQVTSELAFERSGPERFLSTFVLLRACGERIAGQRGGREADLGRLVARIAALHQMSSAVAGALERRNPADVPAAVVKILGTATEGDIADFADLLTDDTVDTADPAFAQLVSHAVDQRPGFTLRGGTNEILRGVVARGLGLR